MFTQPAPCVINVPMAKPPVRPVFADAETSATYMRKLRALQPSGPQLQWVARVKGIDPAAQIDIDGAAAFRRAGLFAYVRPSARVALFVFDPNADGPGCWRYESWLIARTTQGDYGYRLDRPIVCDRRMFKPGDAVDAMRQCELETAAEFRGWLGGL